MDKIERVARAICAARGNNPDLDSGRGPMKAVERRTSAHSTFVEFGPEPRPNWREHETEAKVFIAAHEALADDK
ncbi:MAG: hypothetical protein JWL77_7148 [Chthonomonadaceae bacterium]|nr:hypothetical protein [Chthonomonadaceae bacterium]